MPECTGRAEGKIGFRKLCLSGEKTRDVIRLVALVYSVMVKQYPGLPV